MKVEEDVDGAPISPVLHEDDLNGQPLSRPHMDDDIDGVPMPGITYILTNRSSCQHCVSVSHVLCVSSLLLYQRDNIH